MNKKPDVASDKSQYDRFKQTAHELGCDEDEAAFDENLGRLARQKPSKEESKDAD